MSMLPLDHDDEIMMSFTKAEYRAIRAALSDTGEDAKLAAQYPLTGKAYPGAPDDKPDPTAAVVGSMVDLKIAPGLESVEAIRGLSRYSIRDTAAFKDPEGGYMLASQTLPYIHSLQSRIADLERQLSEARAEVEQAGITALLDAAKKLRDAGATTPIDCKGTIESATNTGLSCALVAIEAEAARLQEEG